MNQGELTVDLIELIKEGLLTNGRTAQIDPVAGNTNQFIYLAEDGSSAIVTVRGPRSAEMELGGARSFASESGRGDAVDVEMAELERRRSADEWSEFTGQDGDDG